MNILIEIFKLDELSNAEKIELLLSVGDALDNERQRNISGPLVYLLIQKLDESHPVLKDVNFLIKSGRMVLRPYNKDEEVK